MTINPRIRENRLFQAVDRLAPYYGLKTNREDIGGLVDAVSAVSYNPNGITRPTSGTSTTSGPTDIQEVAIADLLNRILHSPIGAYTSENLATRLNRDFQSPLTADLNVIENSSESSTETEVPQYNIGNLIQIVGDGPQVRQLRGTFPPIFNKLKYVGILNSAGPGGGGSSIPILDLPESSRPSTNLSVVLLNSPQLNISNRYAKTVSMFLNGVPKLDMAKAVPYLEVNFELPIPPVDSDNRLLLPSIYKFILGGVQANTDSPLYSLQTALSSSSAGPAATNPGFERYQNYSVMGMEAFVSPQILFNRKNNMLESSDARVNSVLDPTRPILSLKSFSTTETPNYSTYSYRTAQLQFTLHDRSRMPDIAPFIRADLRGNTRVDIEYGWHHPDGEELIGTRRRNISPYVDLINGMRRKEKYQIRNSSFSFRENGSVDISLELVTLGQSQVATELIVGSEGLFTAQVQRLREIQEGLSNLLERTSLGEETSQGDSRPSVEIRGIQALEPASDAFSSGLNLNSEQAGQLRQLISYLRAGSSGRRDAPRRAPVFTQIADELERIWGNGNDASGGVARDVRNSLITEITNAVNSMKEYIRGRPSEGNATGWPETLNPNERAAYDPLIIFSRTNGTGSGRMPGLSGLADLATGRGRSPRATNATPASDTAAPSAEGAPSTAASPPTEEEPSAAGLALATTAVVGLELAGAGSEGYGLALGALAPSAEEPAPAAEAAPAAAETTTAPATPPAPTRTGTRSVTAFRGRVPEYLSGNVALQNYTVSLATLMTTFVGKPLMMTNLFEEVQIIFYPFNENAAFANRLNIGNFEVNLGMFTDLLIQYRMNNISRSGTMTLQEFWTFVVQNIIDNPASSSYGLWDNQGPFYRRPTAREDSETTATTRRWSSRPVDDETTLNRRIAVLLEGVTPTKEFHPPQLRMFTECVPVKGEDEEVPPDSNRSVLKIHIYDQQATSLSGIGEILQAERNRALSLDGRPEVNSGDATPMSQQWTRYRERLISSAASGDNPILRNVGGDDASEQRYVVVGGSNRIKNFVMNNYPYLIPGTAMSLINTVNLSSLQDEAANTLNLVNAPRPAELIAPNGEEPGGLPLQVIPVEMTMNTFGCPLLGFATQFFIDMKTGTTADDLYAVNQITSEMQPGKYSTQIKLRPVSGYTRYRNYINELRETASRIREARDEEEADRAAAAATPARPRGRRRESGASSGGSGTTR